LEQIGDLFFIISSADRLKILSEVKRHDTKLTELAGVIDATVQETAKHLKRLLDAGLVEKKSSGGYSLTPFGKLSLELLPSFEFLFKHRDYFTTHDTSFLPKDLLMRIGELSDHVFVEHVSNVLAECQHLVLMAKEYFWWLIDYPLPWVHEERLSENLVKRGILPVDISSEGYRQTRALLGERAEVRFAQSVRVGVVVNEKMAGICFPDLEGRVDFSRGFIGYNSAFQKWCHDLFDYFWSSSSKTWPVELSRQEESAAAKLSRAKVAAGVDDDYR
jgi:predicted transcriptional regulator